MTDITNFDNSIGEASSPEQWASFVLDHLSNESVLLASGARRIDSSAKIIHVPRLSDSGDANWYDELQEIGAGDPVGADLELTPHKVAAVTVLSNEVVADSNPAVRRAMAATRPAPPADTVTFAEAAAEFLRYAAQVRQLDAKTLADYRGVIDGYLFAEFGDASIEAITPDVVDAYKEKLIAEGKLSNRTIVRHLTVLHGIFKRAKRVWRLQDNPASADLVERPKVDLHGRVRHLRPRRD